MISVALFPLVLDVCLHAYRFSIVWAAFEWFQLPCFRLFWMCVCMHTGLALFGNQAGSGCSGFASVHRQLGRIGHLTLISTRWADGGFAMYRKIPKRSCIRFFPVCEFLPFFSKSPSAESKPVFQTPLCNLQLVFIISLCNYHSPQASCQDSRSHRADIFHE